MLENKDHSTTALGFKFSKFILFSNIHVSIIYSISLFFVHLLGTIDTMWQSAKAKTAVILM